MSKDILHGVWPGIEVRQEVARLFRELVYERWARQGRPVSQEWHPACNVVGTEAAIVVELELPGARREDIYLAVSGNILSIASARASTERHRGHWRCHLLERHSGQFTRQILLPHPINRQAMQVEYVDGVLIVTLPSASLPEGV